MADRRRIVTIDSAGTVTTVADLENGATFQSVRDSFTIKPPARHTVMAASSRRYGGARPVDESHDNGEIAWQILVTGTNADAALTNAETVLGVLETVGPSSFFEWRPDGASNSTYYEIRGPGTWTPTYRWAQFQGARSMVIEVSLPVAPLARGAAYDIAIPSTTLPATVALSAAITGDAPALADITLEHSGGALNPTFALIGWTKRPGSPAAGTNVPFGVLEADPAHYNTLGHFTDVTDSAYRSGTGVEHTAPGLGPLITWTVDPSVLVADDFAVNEVDVEVWARIKLTAPLVNPRAQLRLVSGIDDQPYYTAEHGTAYKALVMPSSGSAFRMVRLGTIAMPVFPVAPVHHDLSLAFDYDSGSGVIGVDYLVLVPSRQRALSPTGKANDDTYPLFLRSTTGLRKTVRHDLSAVVARSASPTAAARAPGLGGSPLELPVGNVDLLLKLSSTVPDDPTSSTVTEQLAHTVTGNVRVTPRYWLAKGS